MDKGLKTRVASILKSLRKKRKMDERDRGDKLGKKAELGWVIVRYLGFM